MHHKTPYKYRIYWIRRAKEVCFKCGGETRINKRTGLKYTRCEKHRNQENNWDRKRNGTICNS